MGTVVVLPKWVTPTIADEAFRDAAHTGEPMEGFAPFVTLIYNPDGTLYCYGPLGPNGERVDGTFVRSEWTFAAGAWKDY